jgi:membrane protease subunit HflK
MDFVLSAGRSEVAAQVKTLMQQILDRYRTGILVTTVNLQNTQAPEQVLPAFEDVVRSQQDRERFKNEGQSYANDVVPKARGVAARLMEEANGYRQSMIATATGDAARFRSILTEYERAPGVTRERMYLDTLQQILSATSKVVIDQKSGQNLLYLPIDRLMRHSDDGSAASAAAQPSTDTLRSNPPTEVTPPRGDDRRDALRSRDRDAGR